MTRCLLSNTQKYQNSILKVDPVNRNNTEMRSEVAKRIQSKTPDKVRQEVRDQAWRSFYESIVLSPDEEKEAIFQGKVAKYFRERNVDSHREKS